ncbi:hypothetical protein [Streptomyces sp. NRRL S-337]|uniref:hypothetical protein n=1 Tax=Streptomyces sp. NRRL S-337 TaxID=1463900 RepID=UPI0004CBB7D5|nr:hypothetical protein [Streptomyces sp. NRRL S-337]
MARLCICLCFVTPLIHAAGDAAATRPVLDMDRISSPVLLQTAADQVTIAGHLLPTATGMASDSG